MTERVRFSLKLGLSAFWLLFTVTFAGWWFVLENRNVDRLIEVDSANRPAYERQHRMIFWEGLSWEILLLAGGATLISLVNRERRRGLEVKEFFAAFSHDLKTSIASLRLQAESLSEDLKETPTPLLTRLVADTVRLQLQLENSLYFSAQDSLTLFYETVDLQKLVESLRHQWPDIQIELRGPAKVRADERALRSVLGNLIQNARVHGKARKLTFTAGANQIGFRDDGVGFSGDWSELGRFSHRATATSGSGLGLFIAKTLLTQMNGRLELEPGGAGFGGRLILPEAT